MNIRNSDDIKGKLKVGIPLLCGLIGFVLVFLSAVIFWNGSIDYQVEQEQKSWTLVNATVSDVNEKTKHSNSPGKSGHTFTFYDIHYEYTVDGQIYSGIIENVNYSKSIGDSLKIKYNPAAPEKSTHILESSKDFIVSGLICGIIGLAMWIICFAFHRKCKKSNP